MSFNTEQKRLLWVVVLLGVALVVVNYFLFDAISESDEKDTEQIEAETTESEVSSAIQSVPPKNIAPFHIQEFEGYQQQSREVTYRDTFYDIMKDVGMAPTQIFQVVNQVDDTINLSSLKPGNTYHIFLESDTLGVSHPAYFVYEEDLQHYVTISLKDSVYAEKGEKPAEYREVTVANNIQSSLYESVHEIGETNTLMYRLADLYAWQIDFYRIQKNDAFKVVLEKEFVEGVPTGNIDIKAAVFHHWGEEYYAFQVEHEGRTMYVDEEGNSLQKTFLRAPVRYERISSRYTRNRYHPVLKRYRAHLGTDYVADRGAPIYATADGKIVKAGYTSGNGNYVKIQHNNVYTTGYLHMSRIAPGIKRHTVVKQGQIIGYVGATGLATGPHVCYRFWKHGRQVDPFKQDNPPAENFDAQKRQQFIGDIQKLREKLDAKPFDGESDADGTNDERFALLESETESNS